MANLLTRLLATNRGAEMPVQDKIESLRQRHFALDTLPRTIRVPAIEGRRSETVRGLENASVDDVAFAILGLEAEYSVIADQLFSLRRLYTLARHEGALGFERIVDAVPAKLESQ